MKEFRDNLKVPLIRFKVQFEKSSIFSDLTVFQNYIFDNKFSIKNFQDEFIKETRNVNFENDSDKLNFDRFFEQESEKYYVIYPKLFLNSFFITMYSYFESKLNKLCTIITRYDKKNTIQTIKRKNRESLINWHKRFLKINYKTNFSSIESDWLQIEKFGQIRNAITHNSSNFKKEKSLNEYELDILNSFESISFDEQTGDFFIDDEKFILNFLQLVKRCLTEIYDEIEYKI